MCEGIGRNFQEPVSGDVLIGNELGKFCFAAAFGNVVGRFVRAHKSRRDVREFLVALDCRAQILSHLYAVRGEFRFDGDVVFAFGMADDEYGLFVCGEAMIDIGDSCETVGIKCD